MQYTCNIETKLKSNFLIPNPLYSSSFSPDAPNIFTEYGYTKSHLENTKSIITSINQSIFSSITQSRKLNTTFNTKVWQAVHDYGTLTASNAKDVHLIDHMCHIDPLSDLVLLNSNKDSDDNDKGKEDNKDSSGDGKKKKILKDRLEYLKKTWGNFLVESSDSHQSSDTDTSTSTTLPSKFTANKMESLQEYSSTLAKRKKWLRKKYELNEMLSNIAEQNKVAESILSLMGLNAPYFNIHEVSLLCVNSFFSHLLCAYDFWHISLINIASHLSAFSIFLH